MYYSAMTNLPVENSAANDPCPHRGAMKQVDGEYRAKLFALAPDQEWSVGVASNFIHLDQRSRYCGLPQVVYHYGR